MKAPLHLVTGDEVPTPLDRAQSDAHRAAQSRRSAFAAVVEALNEMLRRMEESR